MVICELVNELTWTPLFGSYLPLSTLEHLTDLEEDLNRFRNPIVLGYLNVDLDEVRSPRSQQVSDLLAEYSLIDQVRHFYQCCRFWKLKNKSQVWQGTVLRPRCDYNLGPD